VEIFKLFGTIMVDNSKANKQLDETGKKAGKAGDGLAELAEEAGLMASSVATAVQSFVNGIYRGLFFR
jgi:hypothetical protein